MVHPLSPKLTKFLWVTVPASLDVPLDKYTIFEGLFLEMPPQKMLG